jgi:hypothetical protein
VYGKVHPTPLLSLLALFVHDAAVVSWHVLLCPFTTVGRHAHAGT